MKAFGKVFRNLGRKHHLKAVSIRRQREAAWREHQNKLLELSQRERFSLAEHDAEHKRFNEIDGPLEKAYNREIKKAFKYDDMGMSFC